MVFLMGLEFTRKRTLSLIANDGVGVELKSTLGHGIASASNSSCGVGGENNPLSPLEDVTLSVCEETASGVVTTWVVSGIGSITKFGITEGTASGVVTTWVETGLRPSTRFGRIGPAALISEGFSA